MQPKRARGNWRYGFMVSSAAILAGAGPVTEATGGAAWLVVFASVGAAAMLGWLLTWWITRGITRPLDELARAISSGADPSSVDAATFPRRLRPLVLAIRQLLDERRAAALAMADLANEARDLKVPGNTDPIPPARRNAPRSESNESDS